MRNRVLAGLAVLVALTLVVVGILGWRAWQQNEFQRAVSLAPADAQRLTWTDWAGVRTTLDADLGAGSSPQQVTRFLDDAFTADLSPMSALLGSAETLHERFGFSPATLEWELFSQSDQGAVVIMQLPADADMSEVTDGFERLGYQRPEADDGVWEGGVDLLPNIGTLTPELQYLAVDAGQRIVVGSDTADYLEQAMAAVTGDTGGVEELDEVVDASGEPLAAAVYDGTVACSSLAMGNADPADRDQAEQLVAAAGEVSPLTGFAMATQPAGDVRVSMSFESEEQARVNADTRAALAAGPAPGQGGDFTDRFELGRVTAEGEMVVMRLEPVEGSYLLSDLTSGPVLFATC